MLSSIHPLGERGRNNRWGLTVTAFTLGAIGAGATIGGVTGVLGDILVGEPGTATLVATALAAGAAAALDLSPVPPPGPSRQVNEHWIGHYRGWVYGAGFGAQLGLGVATYVVTWGVAATLIAGFLSGSAVAAALVGSVFGLGRSLSVLAAGWIDRPTRLASFHQKMARIGAPVRVASALASGALGIVFLIGVVT